MNTKVIGGIVAAGAVLVVAFFGYRSMQLQIEAKKWAGPQKEILEEKFGKDGAVSKAQFVAIVDGPIDAVQRALFEPERAQEVVENVPFSKLVESKGNTKVVEMHLRALTLPIQAYTMEFTLNAPEHRVTFKTLQSQSQDIEAEYKLEASPDGQRTRIDYTFTARDKLALPFPQSVIDSANREIFVNTVRGLKKTLQAAKAG